MTGSAAPRPRGRHRADVPTRWGTSTRGPRKGLVLVLSLTALSSAAVVVVQGRSGDTPAVAPVGGDHRLDGESAAATTADANPSSERRAGQVPLVAVTGAQGMSWVRSTATSARAVARAAGMPLDADDQVAWTLPDLTLAPGADPADVPAFAKSGRMVTVVQVERKAFTRTEVIEVPTRRHTDPSVPVGEHVVVSAGTPGEVRTRTVVVTHDGDVVRRAKKVVKSTKPTPKVIAVGLATDQNTATLEQSDTGRWPAVPGTEGLDWTALAECESSNNPRAANPAGYYGLFQFNLGTWATVGGTGNPRDASAAEQLHRAQLLYASRGAQPWPVCGQRL